MSECKHLLKKYQFTVKYDTLKIMFLSSPPLKHTGHTILFKS